MNVKSKIEDVTRVLKTDETTGIEREAGFRFRMLPQNKHNLGG